ncbi:hypothetical protein [Nonlabens antarcticus]|uniref:hypothetical protein n=1 Tax=Nonlabens antarcticus TaxID=392714 RepID=UPI001891B6B6|nr:hypothetical protein [Nonlabens antarcticus]
MITYKLPSIKKIRILKSVALMAVALLAGNFSEAQSDLKFSVGSQFHFSQIQLESSKFESSIEPGAGIAAGISLGLNEHFSIHSGVGLNYYQSRNSIGSYSSFQDATDISGEDFEFRYTTSNYSETQKLTALSVPLAFQYETSGTVRFYTKLGVEANFFINQESESRATSLITNGFFPRFNAVLDAPRFAGFGTYADQEFNEAGLNLDNSYNATVELGIKQIYSSGSALYIGGFLKYGVNNISNPGRSDGLISFDSQNPTDFRSSSVLNALDRVQDGASGFTTQANLHVYGLAFRYEFNL